MNVCVFGAASAHIDGKYIEAAEKLGAAIAEKGHALIFGAGGTGLMGAVAKGAKSKNGYVCGIVPEYFESEGFDTPFVAADEVVLAADIAERKRIMESRADAFVVLPGGIGTLEEFFEVLTLKMFERHNKTVVVYNAYGYYDELAEFILKAYRENFVTVDKKELYLTAFDAEEVVKLLESRPNDPDKHRKKH